MQPTDTTLDHPAETFLLSNDAHGRIWHTADGWLGCVRSILADSEPVGPFRSIVGARLAVRSEYVAAQSATPRDTAHVRGL